MPETTLGQFRVFFKNFQEYEDILKEVFENNEYEFSCSKLSPFIIDCGSHIGVSILYFKQQYPQARIIAFEPNPDNFAVLRKNIDINNLDNITTINAALSNFEGETFLFGEFGGDDSRSCGNSLTPEWANPGSKKIKVNALLLSSYIQENVDFLKLDVEGEENNILHEVQDKLKLIQEMCVEFHGINKIKKNSFDEIVTLLQNSDFVVDVKFRNLNDYFPAHILDWAISSGLSLATIHAKRRDT